MLLFMLPYMVHVLGWLDQIPTLSILPLGRWHPAVLLQSCPLISSLNLWLPPGHLFVFPPKPFPPCTLSLSVAKPSLCPIQQFCSFGLLFDVSLVFISHIQSVAKSRCSFSYNVAKTRKTLPLSCLGEIDDSSSNNLLPQLLRLSPFWSTMITFRPLISIPNSAAKNNLLLSLLGPSSVWRLSCHFSIDSQAVPVSSMNSLSWLSKLSIALLLIIAFPIMPLPLSVFLYGDSVPFEGLLSSQETTMPFPLGLSLCLEPSLLTCIWHGLTSNPSTRCTFSEMPLVPLNWPQLAPILSRPHRLPIYPSTLPILFPL